MNCIIKNQSLTYSIQKIKEIKNLIGVDFSFLDLTECTIAELLAECMSTGLMASQKNLVLTNLAHIFKGEKNTGELIKCLNLTKASSKVNLYLILDTVYFTNSNLNKIMLVAEYFDFSEIPLTEFENALTKKNIDAKKYPKLTEALKNIFFDNFDLFSAELAKVKFALDANLEEEQIILSLNQKQETVDVFLLIKLILFKQKKQAVALFTEFAKSGVSLTHLNKLIYLAYLNLYLAKQASLLANPVEELSQSSALSPARSALLLKEAKEFSFTYLFKKLQKLADFDYLFKYNTQNIQDVFNFFIMED